MAKTLTNAFSRFTKATTDIKPRIIANSVGEVGTGKTSFWLGAPGPIVIQTLDLGLEGVVEAHAADKDIYIASYDIGQTIGESFTHALAVEAAAKFIGDFEDAIQKARTIVWDRETDVFSLFQYAEFGTDDAYGAAPPKDWDKLKGKIRRMVAMAKASDVNFGLIQGMKNEWVPVVNKKTGAKAAGQSGKRIASGMDDIDTLVHTNLFHERVGKDFSITVGKSRGPGGFSIQDETFENLSFASLAQLIYPDSDESDWV
jgi:hypothetical protein